MEKRSKIILLLVIGIFFWLPLIQYFTHFIDIGKLHGYFKYEEHPEFSVNSWLDNSFQDQFDTYFNQKFGFRDDSVRIHNQLDYSLFKELHANGVIVGKDEYLYETNYIKSYLGDDFIGDSKIKRTVQKIDSIYQILKEHQTEMLLVIAPGKGWFYPEFIPDEMMHEQGPTNYEAYIRELSKTNIPYIDFNDLFIKMKDTSSIVLYPKTGIHWSQGSIPFVLDSIINKTESLLKKDLPHIKYSYPPAIAKASEQDVDMEKGLNLIFPLDIPKMTYPITSVEKGVLLTKPKLIGVADSFFWPFVNSGIIKKPFSDVQFWYYYKQIHATEQNNLFIKDIDPKEELFNTDLVLLMTTDANLYKFPFGFTDALNNNKFDDAAKEKKIQELISYIKTDKKWLEGIKTKADRKGISIDSMLYIDAKYIIEKQK
jgi:hypothetical protein